MLDRWDREKFTTKRSIEDLKEQYYSCCNNLAKVDSILYIHLSKWCETFNMSFIQLWFRIPLSKQSVEASTNSLSPFSSNALRQSSF